MTELPARHLAHADQRRLGLAGVIVSAVTPFDDNAGVDIDTFQSHVVGVVAAGVDGVAVNMDVGEGAALSPTERRALVAAARRAVGPDVPLFAGVWGASEFEAVLCASDAAEAGADAIVVTADVGTAATREPEELGHCIALLGATSSLPTLFVNENRPLAGTCVRARTLEALAEIPSVVGVVDTSCRPAVCKGAATRGPVFPCARDSLRRRGIAVLCGNDTKVFESLQAGADGLFLATGAVGVALYVSLFKRVLAGDLAGAQMLSAEVLEPLTRLMFAAPMARFRSRAKAALALMGDLPNAIMRPPLSGLRPDDMSGLRHALAALGLCRP